MLLPHGVMLDRVERLAADIHKDYGATTPHFLCVLKVRVGRQCARRVWRITWHFRWCDQQGAAEFFSDLSRALRRHHEYFPRSAAPYTFDFIRVKSYENDESTGVGTCRRDWPCRALCTLTYPSLTLMVLWRSSESHRC